MGVVISHQLDGMLHRDLMLFHEVCDLWVYLNFPGGFSGLPPGVAFSLRRGPSSPSLSGVSLVFGQVTSFLVANEAFVVPHVLCSFTGREIDFIHVHCVGVRTSGPVSWWDITVSSSLEFPELHHISVKLSCFVKQLFLFPTSLFLAGREGSGGHHDGKLLGYPSLEGVHQDAVIIDSTVCLGQFKGGGVLVEVSIELVHTERIDSLAGLILDIFWDEGFLKGFA